jgi:hypothetical protein
VRRHLFSRARPRLGDLADGLTEQRDQLVRVGIEGEPVAAGTRLGVLLVDTSAVAQQVPEVGEVAVENCDIEQTQPEAGLQPVRFLLLSQGPAY